MSEEANYKKEVRNRKKMYQDKKLELISQLCTEEGKDKRDRKIDSQLKFG